VVEAKRTSKDATIGQHQAKMYADFLEAMTGQRPVMFYTNGFRALPVVGSGRKVSR
jgi:type I restriction enzyme, R subunit